jgi:hypothetical protein
VICVGLDGVRGSLDWAQDHVVPWLVDNAIAFVALLLSIYAILRQYLNRREAMVSAHFGKTPSGAGGADRFVITNRGPATARHVTATFVNDQGAPWELRTAGTGFLPLPTLAAGDEFHIPIYIILGTGEWVSVTLKWRDLRRGEQERTTTLSLIGVPIGT